MKLSTVSEIQQSIYKDLSSYRVKDSLLNMERLAALLGEWRFNERINTLRTSYQYMLSYLHNGADDPERDKIYRKLLSDAFTLTDTMADSFYLKEKSTLYYSKKRYFKRGSDTMENIFMRLKNELENLSLSEIPNPDKEQLEKCSYFAKHAEQEASELFNAIWINFPSDSGDYEILRDIFSLGSLTPPYHDLMVSALTLNLLEWFDEQKLLILLDNIVPTRGETRERALVGLTLISLRYGSRLLLSDKIRARLDTLFEEPDIVRDLRNIQMQLIRSRETEKISHTLNDEIFSEILGKDSPLDPYKVRSEFMKDPKEEEQNPEWAEYLNKKGLTKKMEEMENLHAEGSDLYMSRFAELKGYPFFSVMSNWFLPFMASHFNFTKEPDSQKLEDFVKMIEKVQPMCSSDKYSTLFSVLDLSMMNRNAIIEMYAEQQELLLEADENKGVPAHWSASDIISNTYIWDLYRFFKLNIHKGEFRDPFEDSLSFFKIEPFKSLFTDGDSLLSFAELFFKKGYYQDALEVYEMISGQTTADEAIYQKIGYCYEKFGEYDKALKPYLQADIIRPDSLWTLRKLASCYRNLHQYDKALEYYLHINKIEPDNLSVELNIGHCYLELKEYELALKHYFKVDYFEPNNNRTLRAIAWAHFLAGKFEQSENYYSRIIANKPNYMDFMNAGHIALRLRKLKDAVAFYKKSIESKDGNIAVFEKEFRNDLPMLIEVGVNENDIPLLLDLIGYEEEGTHL